MELNGTILIADHDRAFAETFSEMLRLRGYSTQLAFDRKQIREAVDSEEFDLLTLDLQWDNSGYDGISILRQVQEIDPFLPVIMITAYASISTAKEAIRMGAFDYFEKAKDREKTLVAIRNGIEMGRLKRNNYFKKQSELNKYRIVGPSQSIRSLLEKIDRLAQIDCTVLITGLSGTGKELVARQLHLRGPRAQNEFVCVDGGLLSGDLFGDELFGHVRGAYTGSVAERPGKFALAEGGTLFLDEISNASMEVQVKLLRVLQSREYCRIASDKPQKCNVRVIAASNRDLKKLVDEGKFREDLFYRLKVAEIYVPPLKDRKEDIPLLARHFVDIRSREIKGRLIEISDDAVSALMDHDWPGNVRELENTPIGIIAELSGEVISADAVMHKLSRQQPCYDDTDIVSLDEMTRRCRKDYIAKVLYQVRGNVAKAAYLLEIDRTHLYRLLEGYGIKHLIKELR